MKKLIIIAGATVLSAGAFAGNFWGTWGYGPGEGVNVGSTFGGYNGSAIRFNVTRNNPIGGTDTLLPSNPNPFYTLCAELGETIGQNSQFHDRVEQLTGQNTTTWFGGASGPVSLGGARTTQLQRLWYTIRTLEGGFGADDWAGAQIAQWEILFDTDLSLASGGGATFWLNSASVGAAGRASSLLAAAGNASTGLANVYLMSDAFQNDQEGRIQDQITGFIGRPPGGNTVPEPFTMGLGIAAAGVFVRRRMKAKTA